MAGISFNSMEQLEEQIVRHQQQIRALHFEIAKRQMQQASQPAAMNTDAFQGGFQGVKAPVQVNPFDHPTNSFGQQSGGAGVFGQGFGQQTTAQAQVNSFEQPGHTSFGSPNQNAFGQKSPTQNAFENNQAQSFGQMNTFDSKPQQQQKRSYGHVSQSSLGPELSPQQPKAFERPQTAPVQSTGLTPNGRMVNINGQFLGRVQAVPTEGFAVSIKRLGKAKFFDYTTVAECLKEWKEH